MQPELELKLICGVLLEGIGVGNVDDGAVVVVVDVDVDAQSGINSMVNSNHKITTQKQKMQLFSLPPGFEPWSPGTKK